MPPKPPRTIAPAGGAPLRLVSATREDFAAIAGRWPLPLAEERACVELSFEDAMGGLVGVYLPQAPSESETEALGVVTKGRVALASALAALGPVPGLVLGCALLRTDEGAFVPGVGLFLCPDPGLEPTTSGPLAALERELPPGSARLLDRALDALAAARAGLPPLRGLKVVPAPYMGRRYLDLLRCGERIYYLHAEAHLEDPIWGALSEAGVEEVIHLPVLGAAPSPQGAAGEPLGGPVSDSEAPPEAPRRLALQDPAALAGASPSAAGGPSRQAASEPPPALGPQGLTPRGARRVFRFLWHLAGCDGEVHPSEEALLADFERQLQIEPEDALVLAGEGLRGEHLTVGSRPTERSFLLEALLDLAAADGRLDRAEERRLVAFAQLIGVSRTRIREQILERFAHQSADVIVVGSTTGEVERRPTPNGVRRILRVLWNLAACDGSIAPGEVKLLEDFRVRYGISRAEASALEAEGRAGRALQVARSQAERELLVSELIEVAAIDGVLSPAERRRILRLGTLLRLDRADLDRRLAERFPPQRAPSSEGGSSSGEVLSLGGLSPAQRSAELGLAGELSAQGPAESGTLVLLGIPAGAVLSLDLQQISLVPDQLGFSLVPAGMHRLALELKGVESSTWLEVAPNEIRVYALKGGRLAPAPEGKVTQYHRLVQGGRVNERLARFPDHRAWRQLTTPLRGQPFPPHLLAPAGGHRNSRLETTWLQVYRGQGPALLAELAYAFLRGLFGDAGALARWSDLVQGIYHCGEELPKRDPALFADLVELLIAQQRLLPPDQLAPNTPAGHGARYLSEDLIDTGVPGLIEAGRRWAMFCGGYHRGAPEPELLPLSVLEPGRSAAAKANEGALRLATRTLHEERRRSGDESRSLIPHLALVGQLQELSGDLRAALETQRDLVRLGFTLELPSELLTQGLRRLARLHRELGQGAEADRLEGDALGIALG